MPIAKATQLLFHFPSRDGVSEKAKLLWLIKLRWIAISLFFALCGPALVFGTLTRVTASWYIGVLSVLIVFNLVSQLTIAESKRAVGPLIICFQLAFDLLALSVLISVAGGFTNPFVTLFLLNASLGGILIQGRLSWPFLLLVHAFLGLLQFETVLNNPDAVDPGMLVTFVTYHLLAFGFWLVMRSLGSYLERQSERQKQSQLALEKQNRLRSIGALAAGFSHEFASPLNVAKIRIERLKRRFGDNEDTAEAMKAIIVCQNVIHQMNSSQMDVRDFHFKHVVVGDLLTDIVDSWREDKEFARVNMNIESAIRSSIPPINFSQVVLNLLDNAYEANPAGEILVELQNTGTEICLSVSDDGPGFPANVIEQRGEPFLTTKKNGTGLGLYVSELFVQSLGGRLKIENKPGRGAIVSMYWQIKEGKE